ncbi:glucuronate isomerase [Flavobacterium sp. 90]|uniref:glucuronate isomerase n=1 Tax=unclassified Flavobacterium TaxID=196869 RepID=UPI000EAE8D55|nr:MULTISPECIES: glucuronate isomerase [unclassified Flavobacterium]RKR04750.1 D-glucuronate isomerase [Flavobacterium sp. 81]TCK56071.1 glucuronate isomerase [Flavobacterium sp. 90]
MSENKFITEDFLLYNKTAVSLYHNFAKAQPIIDYHCHLSPKDIAEDLQFKTITEIWIEGDHYKWRAMRANGISEKYITGDASDFEKFEKWAETLPHTLRNPLYHWSHLELKRYFGIDLLLNKETAKEIYDTCNELLKKPEFSVKNLLRRMNVKVVGTTDDPTDDLQFHQKLRDDEFEILVLPSFRPDKATEIEKGQLFVNWIQKLETVVGFSIKEYADFIKAIGLRHDFFHEMGGRISDHGHIKLYASTYTKSEIESIFKKGLNVSELSVIEIEKFKSAVLFEIALMNHKRSWAQQFHVGAIRNNNSKMMQLLGPDQGFDSIGDLNMADNMSGFFDKLNSANGLTKTIVYNLNPRDNEVFASMVANFNDDLIPGKMQYGAAWWFLDQKDGMEKQLNVLSNFGLLSRFVGMVTDSRSFLSFPRHEYFRRILCNILGNEVENGQLPNDINLIGELVRNICSENAERYFNFKK